MAELINQMQEIMCTSCTECEVNWCDGEDREECKWMQKIAEVGASIEAEIRVKAIDDFADRMISMMPGHKQDISKIAEQLKGGAE